MPFIKRSVDPIYIRRHTLDKAEVTLGGEHEAVVNGSLVHVMRQIAELSVYVSDLFQELTDECIAVVSKSERLKTRISTVQQTAKCLDALQVSLTESSLETVADQLLHYNSKSGAEQETNLFKPESRPQCVQTLYHTATALKVQTPAGGAADANKDLQQSLQSLSRTFFVQPVLTKPGPATVLLNNHKRQPYVLTNPHWRQRLLQQPQPSVPRGPEVDTVHSSTAGSKRILPTPEEKLALAVGSRPPAVVIQVDTSSANFEKMAARRHLMRQHSQMGCSQRAEGRTAPTRRLTIAGMPGELSRTAWGSTQAATENVQLASLPESSIARPLDLRQRSCLVSKDPGTYIIEDEGSSPDFERASRRPASVFGRILRRSRSLPRGFERLHQQCRNDEAGRRTRLIPADYHEPTSALAAVSTTVGALVDDRAERVYVNFYGKPNTELVSLPWLPEGGKRSQRGMLQSKSEHGHHGWEGSSGSFLGKPQRAKSHGQIDQFAVNVAALSRRAAAVAAETKLRPRSISSERLRGLNVVEAMRGSSGRLSRTLSGFFRRKPTVATQYGATSLSASMHDAHTATIDEGRTRGKGKRMSQIFSGVMLRKRDSKATNSSSGRWSGSERYSTGSDGGGLTTSYSRLSRLSSDRDSAVCEDLDRHVDEAPEIASTLHESVREDESTSVRQIAEEEEVLSIYSVDQDGFYTTMHADSCLNLRVTEQSTAADGVLDITAGTRMTSSRDASSSTHDTTASAAVEWCTMVASACSTNSVEQTQSNDVLDSCRHTLGKAPSACNAVETPISSRGTRQLLPQVSLERDGILAATADVNSNRFASLLSSCREVGMSTSLSIAYNLGSCTEDDTGNTSAVWVHSVSTDKHGGSTPSMEARSLSLLCTPSQRPFARTNHSHQVDCGSPPPGGETSKPSGNSDTKMVAEAKAFATSTGRCLSLLASTVTSPLSSLTSNFKRSSMLRRVSNSRRTSLAPGLLDRSRQPAAAGAPMAGTLVSELIQEARSMSVPKAIQSAVDSAASQARSVELPASPEKTPVGDADEIGERFFLRKPSYRVAVRSQRCSVNWPLTERDREASEDAAAEPSPVTTMIASTDASGVGDESDKHDHFIRSYSYRVANRASMRLIKRPAAPLTNSGQSALDSTAVNRCSLTLSGTGEIGSSRPPPPPPPQRWAKGSGPRSLECFQQSAHENGSHPPVSATLLDIAYKSTTECSQAGLSTPCLADDAATSVTYSMQNGRGSSATVSVAAEQRMHPGSLVDLLELSRVCSNAVDDCLRGRNALHARKAAMAALKERPRSTFVPKGEELNAEIVQDLLELQQRYKDTVFSSMEILRQDERMLLSLMDSVMDRSTIASSQLVEETGSAPT